MSKKLIRLNPKPNIFTFIHERAPGRWATKKIPFIIYPKLLGRKNFNYPKLSNMRIFPECPNVWA
jgi:hypothetical protein